jgi:hypothetical protein
MSPGIVEGDLLFEFDEELWKPLVRWDKHAAYRTGIREIENGKGVDFIGIYKEKTLFFIEVKDYRLRDRTKPVPPWEEFELKVRNTVAGLVGSKRREKYADECAPFVDALINSCKLTLVYWIEIPPPASPALRRRRIAATGFAARQTGRMMKWLNARAFNVSQEDEYVQLVPGVRVQNLPRRRSQLAEAVEAELLSRGLTVDESARDRLSQELDVAVLEDWLERAATVSRVEELFGGRR